MVDVAWQDVDWLLQDVNWLHFLTIPLFTGVVGWLINWTGLFMLFNPTYFHGKRLPGMRTMATLMPRRVQEIPGIMHGALGWQGIVPSRAAKMGSIAADKAILKLGTTSEYYHQLDPQAVAEHVIANFRPQIPTLVDEVMRAEQPRVWRDVPQSAKAAVYTRVQNRLPETIHGVFETIGQHIDQLLDPKLMIIDHFEKNPGLVVKIFRDFGERELRVMVNVGFTFGFLLGWPLALLDHWFAQWWLLPVLGSLIGWVTNELGMWLIFEPAEPKKFGPIKFHGLFARRQEEAGQTYARILADDVMTLENIGDYLLEGPSGDRTRQILVDALRPIIDHAVGPLQPAVRIAVGQGRYDAIKDRATTAAVDMTTDPFRDKALSAQQSAGIRRLVEERTKIMVPRDFVDMMRAAIREDEWLLYLHGAIMGFGGGYLHLYIFGAGS
ncbi:MAG: hypothetical protein IPI32_12695 [Austwickia sp.]|nr:hypothetical protein [Austwickia sp.]MBK8435093.1 hypothetical protein [Austwickia sp.]MBK9101353.1 hypothetical protein [Austwickia sp.]